MAGPARAFRSSNIALVRAVARPTLPIPAWPDLTAEPSTYTDQAQVAWLRAVLNIADVDEGLQQASPVLAAQTRARCESARPRRRDVKRAVLSVARYLLRAGHRPTPFGLFAGVTTARFGPRAQGSWGGEPVAVVRAGAAWLAEVVTHLESCPELLSRLSVMANSTMTTRGDRLIVPYQPYRTSSGTGAVEVSLAHTVPVATVLAVTRTPARVGDVKAKLLADFPEAGPEHVDALLKELVERRALITCLHAPSTETDALGYLLDQLAAADAGSVKPVAGLVESLREIHTALRQASTRPLAQARTERVSAAEKMRALMPGRKHPLAVDLRLTDADLTLPPEVAREAERATLVLARLSAEPFGTAAWKAHHMRFYERFGIGSMVPLKDVIADSGIGFPDGYPGTVSTERRPVSERDEALVRLAQAAVLDGRDEVVLDESLIAELALGKEEVRLRRTWNWPSACTRTAPRAWSTGTSNWRWRASPAVRASAWAASSTHFLNANALWSRPS